jgi:hypothetical protein
MESYSQPSSISDIPSLPSTLTIDKYESGKAEALGTLCRIMCAKKTGEEILPVYLARFYLAVQQGLRVPPNRECGETMVAILMNSSDLFRLDLDGIRVLVPVFISALEIVLPDKDLKLNSSVSKTELRRASIHLLSSILVLPLHFQNVTIKDLINTGKASGCVLFDLCTRRACRVVRAPHNFRPVETPPDEPGDERPPDRDRPSKHPHAPRQFVLVRAGLFDLRKGRTSDSTPDRHLVESAQLRYLITSVTDASATMFHVSRVRRLFCRYLMIFFFCIACGLWLM